MDSKRFDRGQCADMEDLIVAYVDGRIEPARSRVVTAHVAACSRCAALLKRHQGTKRLLHLSSADSWNPPDLRLRIAHAIARPPRRRTLWPAGLAACAAIVVLLGAFAIGQPSWWQAISPAAAPPATMATATTTTSPALRSCPGRSGRASASCRGVSWYWLPTVRAYERSDHPARVVQPQSAFSPPLHLERHSAKSALPQTAPKGGGTRQTTFQGQHGLVPM